MQKLINLVKKIVIGILLIYSYNVIAVAFNMTIPINYITILLVAFLDIPAMLLLTLSLSFVF